MARHVIIASLWTSTVAQLCNESATASERLRSHRPLRIASISGYSSYSDFDASGTFLNNTFDSSLLHALQRQLGFSYEPVQLVSKASNASWSEFVPLVLEQYDMLLTYWSRDTERQNLYAIPAHTTNNRIVIISVEGTNRAYYGNLLPTWDRMASFFWDPFTNELWVVFIFMFLLNAVGLYCVEYDHHDFEHRSWLSGLGLSLYFSFGLLTGACDHSPNTAPGRCLFALWGVCIVLSVAWYTGDLAGSQAADKIGSRITTIAQLASAGLTVCYPTSNVRSDPLGQLDPLEPNIVYHAAIAGVRLRSVPMDRALGTRSQIAIMESYMDQGRCAAMVVPQKGYNELLLERQDNDQCDAHPSYRVTEPIVVSAAGWAVSFPMTGCLVPALEYGFQALRYTPAIAGSDVMQNLESIYLNAGCSNEDVFETTVGLTHLGLAYIVYMILFCVVCLAAVVKRCRWTFIPSFLRPVTQKEVDEGTLEDDGEGIDKENSKRQPTRRRTRDKASPRLAQCPGRLVSADAVPQKFDDVAVSSVLSLEDDGVTPKPPVAAQSAVMGTVGGPAGRRMGGGGGPPNSRASATYYTSSWA